MKNLKVKVLIDMKDIGYAVKIASKLQRSGIYAAAGKGESKEYEREMMFEKYRIIVTDETEKYQRSSVQTIVITNDDKIEDMIIYCDNTLHVSQKIGIESICSLIKFQINCGGNKVKSERAASSFLREIGIQTNLKGYKYLRTGIVCAALQPEIMEKSTYEIYDVVAEKYNVNGQSVERAMRNAIELAYERSPKLISQKFSYPVAKPSNTELIIFAADTIRTWCIKKNV
ncbi:MAG: sporulation initiation factor Spo0A C-terminal domain-containing protein [Ruminococcus sp.]